MTTLATTIDGATLPDQNIINLKWPERYISAITGVKIGLSGFKSLFKSPLTSLIKIGTGGYLLNRGITGHCELYEKVGKTTEEPVEVTILTSVQVDKPRGEVYEFWRKLDNLPLFMEHLKSVELLEDGNSRWTLKLPVDITAISWDAEIVFDEPGNVIAWQSLPDAMIQNTGTVRFMDTPTPDTTLIHVAISYRPPAGVIGAGIAYLINPLFQKMVVDDVQNFKRYMDVGNITDEIVVIEISTLTP
jgi:uncharacterized membrane protein